MHTEKLQYKKVPLEERGFYTEKLINPTKYYENDSIDYKLKTKIIQYKNQTRTIPILHELEKPTGSKIELHPAITWINFNKNLDITFPDVTIQPKIQILNIAPSGQIPREVEVERRKREFSKENISGMLKQSNIEIWKLLPIYFIRNEMDENRVNKYQNIFNLFPLEWFDDYEFDCMTIEDWLNMGKINTNNNNIKRYSIPAYAFLPNQNIINTIYKERKSTDNTIIIDCETNKITTDGIELNISGDDVSLDNLQLLKNYSFHWTQVSVSDYDYKKMRWLVTDLDTNKSYKIPRIYLMFLAENPKIFVHRVLTAIKRRDAIENFLKFQLITDSMILTGIPLPNTNQMKRIFNITFIKHIKNLRIPIERVEQMEFEVKLNFQSVLAQIELIHDILEYPDDYQNLIEIPDISLLLHKSNVYGNKKLPISFTNFKIVQQYIRKNILYNLFEPLSAMSCVIEECLKVLDGSFFNWSIMKSITLNDFQSTQNHVRDMTINYLRDTWIITLARKIRINLHRLGKGWFDIECTDWKIFQVSKLFRFLSVVKQIMQTTVRESVRKSIAQFVNILTKPCECLIDVIEQNYVWNSNDLITSPFQCKGRTLKAQQYLFAITIMISVDDGAPQVGDAIYFSTNPRAFLPVILQLFDETIVCAHTIKQLDSMIVTNLIFSNDLYLSSIGLQTDEIQRQRNYLTLCYEKALIPLLAYAKNYEKYIELFRLNVKQYIEELKAQQLLANKIKDIIAMHFYEKEKLHQHLPETIIIGPFDINVNTLKQILINKRQLLAEKVLDYFAERMRDKTLDLISEFQTINKRLVDRPVSIEAIYETKNWIETSIPIEMPILEEQIKKIFFEYEVLDFFYYNLSNDDMFSKWNVYAWPLKITKQIVNTQEMFDEETMKFLQLQINDLSEFESKIENVNVQVHSYSTADDINKAIEYSIEIKKLWNNIEELIKRGELLNERQRLFDEPEIQLDQLHNTLENFQPYKKLWLTATEFLKSKETWCGNPIVNIDIDAVNNLMEKYQNSLKQSVELFMELSKIQNVANEFLARIEQFKVFTYVLTLIKHPSFLPQHWQELIKSAQIEMKFNLSINFKYCIDKGIMEHVGILEGIAKRAIAEQRDNELAWIEQERLRIAKEQELLNKNRNRRGRTLD